MPRDAFLYVVASFLCLGVGMGLLMPWGVIFVVVLLILGVVIAGAAAYLKKSTLMLGAITLLALSLGIGRAQFEVAWEASQTLLGYIGQTASIVGTVAEDPDRRDTSLHLSVQVEKINNTPARGEILVMVGREELQALGIAASLLNPSLAGFAVGSLLLGLPFPAPAP